MSQGCRAEPSEKLTYGSLQNEEIENALKLNITQEHNIPLSNANVQSAKLPRLRKSILKEWKT
jgi:hypothetical protein